MEAMFFRFGISLWYLQGPPSFVSLSIQDLHFQFGFANMEEVHLSAGVLRLMSLLYLFGSGISGFEKLNDSRPTAFA